MLNIYNKDDPNSTENQIFDKSLYSKQLLETNTKAKEILVKVFDWRFDEDENLWEFLGIDPIEE